MAGKEMGDLSSLCVMATANVSVVFCEWQNEQDP